MRLFVSHIHEEADLALAMKRELLTCFGNQIEVFLAEDISLGTNWLTEIQSALTRAQVVLVLFSRRSITRPWINIEAGYGVMAGKQVLPLCHSGFSKAELPVIYGLLQAMEIAQRDDVGRLLDQIARNTPAGRLLVDRTEAVERWLECVRQASVLTPHPVANFEDPPCIWVIGSNSKLPKARSEVNEKFVGYLAYAMVQHGFRVVFGRSRLLNFLGNSMVTEDALSPEIPSETLSKFANASAMMVKAAKAPPNPILVLGSIRTSRGVRATFLDSIGRVPDVVITIGGSLNGRTPEEVEDAKSAGIPLLPLKFTGGFSATAEHSFSKSLNDEIEKLQRTSRDFAAASHDLCEIIRRQTAIARSQ